MDAYIARTVCPSRAYVHLVPGGFAASPLPCFVAATDSLLCLYVVDESASRPRLWRLCEQRVFGTIRALQAVPCANAQVQAAQIAPEK